MSEIISSYVVKDVDWNIKIVSPVDCSTNCLNPLLQIKLHCVETAEPLIFEFTLSDAQTLIQQLNNL